MEAPMKLHAPVVWVFVLSLVLAVLAVFSFFYPIPHVSEYRFWLAVVGYVVLALGNLVEA
jgi:hypothetical protein